MQIIKLLTEQIGEELCDAEAYANLANLWKDRVPDVAAVFMMLSKEEMAHQQKLHDAVVQQINKARSEGKTPTPEMQGVYDYLHMRNIDHAARVITLQKMYDGR